VSSAGTPSHEEQDPRRRALLEAALGVFTRYGFRKASMDEVARAAQVSRQALYLHFSNKETLFRATVRYALDGSLRAASGFLRDPELPIDTRLIRGFDEWIGRFVGMMGADASDLASATGTLTGPMIKEYEALLVEAVARAIAGSGLAAAYKPARLTARQLADTLHATARGLKYSSATREEFGRQMTIAVKAMCAPLGGKS
jgi:AcrR family transcriptional regulator